MSEITRTQHRFSATVSTLTPLHIGTGVELMKDIDFYIEGNTTHFINVEQVLIDLWDEKYMRGEPRKPAEILRTILPQERTRYITHSARGAIRATNSGSKLRECIKTDTNEPYIPGSSLKGALRTALAWTGWEQQIKQPITRASLGRNRSWAGQEIEGRLFRDGAQRTKESLNRDLLRALHVGDLHITNMGRGYEVLNIQVARTRDFASPIEIEAVGGDAVFRGRISIDTFLFSDQAKGLGFQDRQQWLTELSTRVNKFSGHQLERVIARLGSMQQNGVSNLRQSLTELQNSIPALPATRCVLCLGWGGGWDSKTVGSHLQKDPVFFEQIIAEFRLSRGRVPRRPGDPFPRTRRVMVRQHDGDTRIRGTLGWVVLDLETLS
jgi:CRISPR-associated protein Csm5